MTGVYRLEAQISGQRKRAIRQWCEDSTDATFWAMARTLDLAAKDRSGPWAKGEIRLIAPDGQILRTMPEKEPSDA
jgi:hypothetical protein